MITRRRVALFALCATLASMMVGAEQGSDGLDGEALFVACSGCHERDEGAAHRVGPNLFGLKGRVAASLEGFSYSPALTESGITWDTGSLTAWILAPEAMVPGTWMLYHNPLQPSEVSRLVDFLLESPQEAIEPVIQPSPEPQ